MGWLESLPAHRHWCWVTTSIGRAPIAQATGDGGLRSGIAVRNADWPWRDLSRMVATSRAKYFRLRVLVPAPTPAKGSRKRPAPESWRPKVDFHVTTSVDRVSSRSTRHPRETGRPRFYSGGFRAAVVGTGRCPLSEGRRLRPQNGMICARE